MRGAETSEERRKRLADEQRAVIDPAGGPAGSHAIQGWGILRQDPPDAAGNPGASWLEASAASPCGALVFKTESGAFRHAGQSARHHGKGRVVPVTVTVTVGAKDG